MAYNYKKNLAIQENYKKQLTKLNPTLNNESGIYMITRTDENGFKFAYIGQARHCLDRLSQHMNSHVQHIDNSLHKRKLYDENNNPHGWWIEAINYPIDKLDEMEQFWIKDYATRGYQLLNKTTGSQSNTKSQLGEPTERKGYREGVENGYKKASKEIDHLFELHLDVKTKSDKSNKTQEKALEKFKNFLNYHKNEEVHDNG